MGATTTTLTAAIGTTFEPGMTKTFYEGTPTLNLLGFPGRENTGGDSIDWKLNYAGNAGAILNEGDALPASGNQTYADMTIAHTLFVNVVEFTGHAIDAMKNGYFNGIQAELDGGVSGLLHKIEEKFVTVLEGAVNDDTSYGGQTRATVHADSYVVAGGSAANTLANLSELYEALTLDPRGVVYDPMKYMFFSANEQLTAYTEIATGHIVTGDAEASGAHRPYVTNQTDGTLDAGMMKHTLRYNGLPWYGLPTATNTLVTLCDRTKIVLEQSRPVTIEPLAKTDDNSKFLISWHGGLAYLDPYRAGRIEALTT